MVRQVIQDLVFAPGHGYTKLGLGSEATPEQKIKGIFPSIIRHWPSSAPVLDEHTYLIEVEASTNPNLNGQVRLVGEQVKNLGTDTNKTFARNADKFSTQIAPWLALAALSSNVPEGTKKATISGKVLSMLPYPDLHLAAYRQALLGQHKVKLHRKSGLETGTVELDINWLDEDQIQVYQEGAYGFFYCKHHGLFGDIHPKALYASQDTGMNTAIIVLQDAKGHILRVEVSEDSGAVGLAANLKAEPKMRQRIGGDCDSTILIDAFSSKDPKFIYGHGRGIAFADIFDNGRQQWEEAIDSFRNSVIPRKQRASLHWVLLLGGTSHHYEKDDPLILRLSEEHDPQRADVEGLRIYAIDNGIIQP